MATPTFTVPTRNDVSPENQAIFDNLQKAVGFTPNLFAFLAWNQTALGDYLALQNRKSALSGKEREIINLVVSQVNECAYCVPAHITFAKMHGFTEEQTVEIRRGHYEANAKYDALARFVKAVATTHANGAQAELAALLEAGYTQAQLIDIIVVVGDKIITNYLHNLIKIPVDFPAVPAI